MTQGFGSNSMPRKSRKRGCKSRVALGPLRFAFRGGNVTEMTETTVPRAGVVAYHRAPHRTRRRTPHPERAPKKRTFVSKAKRANHAPGSVGSPTAFPHFHPDRTRTHIALSSPPDFQDGRRINRRDRARVRRDVPTRLHQARRHRVRTHIRDLQVPSRPRPPRSRRAPTRVSPKRRLIKPAI